MDGDNVFQLNPSADTRTALRDLANSIDDGEYRDDEGCTIIFGGKIFHFGSKNHELGVLEAIWNMNYGIHWLMKAATSD